MIFEGAALKKANYRGYLSLEALDSRESEQKLKDDIPFLRNVFQRVKPDK